MNTAVLIDIAFITALLCDKKVFVVNKQIIIIGYCPAVYLICKPVKSEKRNKSVAYTSQRFLNSKMNVFKRIIFCSPSLNLFDPKHSKNSNVLKYLYYLK